ncbi:MAG: RNA methyltransferase [Rhodospirillales bacterium]|nr:RNA methyltransferase [Rhodospirillales bacterium]
MKPPHGKRPTGPGRPPQDRGSGRGHGGPAQQGGPGGHGPRRDDRPRGSFGPSGGGSGPRHGAAKPDRDRAEGRGPRPFGASAQGHRASGAPAQARHGEGEHRTRTNHDAPRPYEPARTRARDTRGHDGGSRHERSHGSSRATAHGADAPKGAVWLYGQHAVAAALANPARRLRRLLLTEEAEAALAQRQPQPWALSPERTERARLDQLLGRDVVHQGVALLADPLPPPSLQAALERPGPLLVLDQVTDPRNVGAILRAAAAFGAAAVITQDRNAPEETGALAKAASGALETVPLLRAVNIARTLIALKAANVWCIGLDAAGEPLSGPALADRRVALVLGAEGEGMRRLTRETCDLVAGLTIKSGIDSLNVSAAAAVALYELTRAG